MSKKSKAKNPAPLPEVTTVDAIPDGVFLHGPSLKDLHEAVPLQPPVEIYRGVTQTVDPTTGEPARALAQGWPERRKPHQMGMMDPTTNEPVRPIAQGWPVKSAIELQPRPVDLLVCTMLERAFIEQCVEHGLTHRIGEAEEALRLVLRERGL